MIGIFTDQHLRDQRLGGQPGVDNARGCRGLDRSGFARAAAIARSPGDEHAERGGHDIEPLGDIFADNVEITAAAGAGLVFDIDDLFNPFEMRRQRAPVGLAWSRCAGVLLHGVETGLHAAQRCVEFFERELQLILIELLGAGAETVTLECGNDRVEPCDLSFGLGADGLEASDPILALGKRHVALCDLAMGLNDHRAQRVQIVGKVGLE